MALFKKNRISKEQEKKNEVQRLGSPLITAVNPTAVVSEQFRTLRSNIQFLMVDQTFKSLMFTSATPFEGKSTVSVNVANVFASDGNKVCFVDADLRKPTVHRTFDISNKKGLTTVLTGQAPISEVIQKVPGLSIDVISSGAIPPNPAEMLSSKAMLELIDRLESVYDLVIFDAPPILAVTDAQILSSRIDGTVLVARQFYVKRDQLAKAKDLLEIAHSNLLGVVLNDVEVEGDSSYYYYYRRED